MSAAIEVEHSMNPRNSSSITSNSSLNLRSSQSENASSQSFGSSLETASASAHLERYDTPWSITEMAVFKRGERARVRSYSAVLDWNNAAPSGRHHLLRNCRPLAGTSRKRLIWQIHQLTKDKADLEAQLAAIVMGGPLTKTSLEKIGSESKPQSLASAVEGAGEESQLGSRSSQSSRGLLSSLQHTNDSLVRSMSPLNGSDELSEATSPASLEHISTLAILLRDALKTSTTYLLDEENARLLERPGMKALLLKKPPNIERAQLHARFFAQRLIEAQKKPEKRCKALKAGPLQQAIRYPAYVDILMQGLREPFIAHMGVFDEDEFGLWILNGVEFHSEALNDTDVENEEINDDYYEFPDEFFQRFPFTGTKANIDIANRWRAQRGDPPITQTSEMAAAEEYTRARQRRVLQEDDSPAALLPPS
ncbi:hypothetical protein CBS101457_001765 [Exobasidium rhododendri]|nr:hypothetical protein CBS101457_001765 [Exobasidium rhododendri]